MSKTKKLVCILLFVPLAFMIGFQAYVARDIEKNVAKPIKQAYDNRNNLDYVIVKLEVAKAYLEREGLKDYFLYSQIGTSLAEYKRIKEEYTALKKCRRNCWDAKETLHLKRQVASLRLKAEPLNEVNNLEFPAKLYMKHKPYHKFIPFGYFLAIIFVIVSLIMIVVHYYEARKEERESSLTMRGKGMGIAAALPQVALVRPESPIIVTCGENKSVYLYPAGSEDGAERFASENVLLEEARQKQAKELERQKQQLLAQQEPSAEEDEPAK